MTIARWYFDYVSPYAYLQLRRLDELPGDVQVACVPVLFAGLLGHFGHKGPAEIPLKRQHTYRQCLWLARRHGIPFRMPPGHPFNPLPLLRETLYHGADRALVTVLFRGVFEQGLPPGEAAFWRWCANESGRDLGARTDYPDTVKQVLCSNTEQAAAAGIYGVPTFAVGEETFWGVDATGMLLDYLADPLCFADDEYRRLATLPVAQARD